MPFLYDVKKHYGDDIMGEKYNENGEKKEEKTPETCEELEYYLEKCMQDNSSRRFYYYTKIKTAENILKKGAFWLTDVNGFNDTKDTEQFGEDKDYSFSLCFSRRKKENLPMWYLYSGIDGKGCRIELTEKKLQKLRENGKYTLIRGISEGDDKYTILDSVPLEKGKTMDIKFKDILYEGKLDRDGKCELKYSSKRISEFSQTELEKYKKKNRGFVKGMIWNYEKETRLLVRLRGEAEERLREWRKSAQTSAISYHVELSFDEALLKQMKIVFAPNLNEEEEEAVIRENDGFKKFLKFNSPMSPSEYAGTVRFDLCRNCPRENNK